MTFIFIIYFFYYFKVRVKHFSLRDFFISLVFLAKRWAIGLRWKRKCWTFLGPFWQFLPPHNPLNPSKSRSCVQMLFLFYNLEHKLFMYLSRSIMYHIILLIDLTSHNFFFFGGGSDLQNNKIKKQQNLYQLEGRIL